MYDDSGCDFLLSLGGIGKNKKSYRKILNLYAASLIFSKDRHSRFLSYSGENFAPPAGKATLILPIGFSAMASPIAGTVKVLIDHMHTTDARGTHGNNEHKITKIATISYQK